MVGEKNIQEGRSCVTNHMNEQQKLANLGKVSYTDVGRFCGGSEEIEALNCKGGKWNDEVMLRL